MKQPITRNKYSAKIVLFHIQVIALLCCVSTKFYAQESVFKLFEGDLVTADEYYVNGNYKSALSLYEDIANKKTAPANIDLRLARCYYFTHDYKKAVNNYQNFMADEKLSSKDQFYYAESLTATGNYEKSAEIYAKCYEEDSQNEMLAGRIWQMNNISYLFEDSLENAVRYISLNSNKSELLALPYKNGVVYASNKQPVAMIQKRDTKSEASFYHLYYADARPDPFSENALIFNKSVRFTPTLGKGFHVSALDFYDDNKKMIVTMSSQNKNAEGKYPLQLFFASLKNDRWEISAPFSHNNPSYSLSEPSISADGQKLFFSSDMPDGYGGRDIYVSNYEDNTWSTPQNLGSAVNTLADETFPYLGPKNTLYFSSNGHPGIGGIDIFKADLLAENYGEIENLGYPINSGYDDFAFAIDSLNRHGFLSSNRREGGLNDDIYEFDLGLQSYPLKIEGVVKFIEHNWMDSSELEPLPNVELILIDANGNERITETTSGSMGGFDFTIPYYSKYKIRIIGNGLDGIVSFEVPKYAESNINYEIVVVNDDFKKSQVDMR